MKYKHNFTLEQSTDSSRTYRCDSNRVRLDFMEHMLRVAILRDDSFLMPTYTVCPDFACKSPVQEKEDLPFSHIIPKEGRDKLSTEGFKLLSPKVTEDEKSVHFQLDEINVDIELFNFRMKLSNDKGLLYEDRAYISYNFDHELGKGSYHFITREADEKIFGLGDKTGPVNKNGMSFRMAASDSMGFDARSSDPLYKQLPFYICENTNGAYGIYYDTYSNGEMNFGKEINNYYSPFKSFRCEEENLVFYIIFGSVPEIVRRFSMMCGPMLFPPKWTLQYCGSTMNYTDADNADEQLRGFIKQCEEYDLHPGGFYLSSGYTQIGDKRYVFHWNTDKIPNPEDLSSYFKEHGVEFLPNIKPAFLVNHPLYEEIAKKGWFLHYEDGTPAIIPFWDDYGSYLDFTNPEAYAFWTDCVKKQLVDKGYHNTWNDNNEYDITDEEVYAYGFGHPVKAHEIRPLFSFLMTMASLEAQDHSKRIAAVSRCGIGGLSRIATTWTGDNNTSFDDFRYNHRMAMTMSLSGFYNFGQDIGGFAGPRPEEELFLRWIQYGIFTPRFVLHSWNPDGTSNMPWLYENRIGSVKELFDLRDRLLPYLYNEMYRSVTSHDPIIYPVFLKYPSYDTEADCFFFGDNVLACPVFDKGATKVSVTLPENEGGWYYGDRHFTGDVTLPCTFEGQPVWFVKAGCVMPYANIILRDAFDLPTFEPSDFVIYPLEEGSFQFSYLVDDGISNLTPNNHKQIRFVVTCKEEEVNVSVYNADLLKISLVDRLNRKLNVRYHS